MRIDGNDISIQKFDSDIFHISDIETVEISNSDLTDVWRNDYFPGDLFLVDENVWDLVKTPEEHTFKITAIEENKTMNSVFKLLDFLLEKNLTKKNKLIVIGGGITQDIGSFTCHILKRGVGWIFIPTTLLAMGDSSIGGKSGINYNNVKNCAAVFESPMKVITNVKFLETLTFRDVNSGLAEILKLAITGSKINEYRRFLKDKDYISLIKLGIEVKAAIVEVDRFEKNIRKVLNYGHTFGHAIEIACDYAIPHGLAVAIGCYLDNHIILPMINCDDPSIYDDDILYLISTERENISKIDFEKMFSAMASDKKNLGNKICFVSSYEGNSEFVYVEMNEEIKNRIISKIRNI